MILLHCVIPLNVKTIKKEKERKRKRKLQSKIFKANKLIIYIGDFHGLTMMMMMYNKKQSKCELTNVNVNGSNRNSIKRHSKKKKIRRRMSGEKEKDETLKWNKIKWRCNKRASFESIFDRIEIETNQLLTWSQHKVSNGHGFDFTTVSLFHLLFASRQTTLKFSVWP